MALKKEIDFGKRLAIGGLRLPIIDQGTNALGIDDSMVDEEAFQKIVDVAMANGYNYFDTSWFYHGGNSERAIGIPCTNCRYCEEACPLDIPAGDYFMLYNGFYQQKMGNEGSYFNNVSPEASQYGFMIERRTPAGDCIGCKKCLKVCPQHLPIVDLLKDKVHGELWAANPDAVLAGIAAESHA